MPPSTPAVPSHASVRPSPRATDDDAARWYAGGLQFSCQWRTCNACCRGQGYVWVNDAEVDALAEHLGLAREAFIEQYTYRTLGRRALQSHGPGENCVFLRDDGPGCTVYDVRPSQCQSYPFWPELLETADTWLTEADFCPGIHCGAVHDVAAIARKVATKRPCPSDAGIAGDASCAD